MCSPGSLELSREVTPELYFRTDPEETDKKEQAAAGKGVSKDQFQASCTAPAPEFAVTQPEVVVGSEGSRCPLALSGGWCPAEA